MDIYNLDKVIVLGATGFIGRNIYNHLTEKNNLIVEGYSSKNCNLLDPSHVNELFNADNSKTTVIICSAIPRMKEDSWEAMLKNITIIYNLTSSVHTKDLRSVIFISSVDIYGNNLPGKPIDEDTMPNPIGFYGLSKYISERILQSFQKDFYPVTCLRMPGIYGPDDSYKSIIGKFINKALNRETIEIYGEGRVKRDYVDIRDIYKVTDFFVKNPYTGVVNVATGRSISIKDIVLVISSMVNIKVTVECLENKKDKQCDMVFNISRLKSVYKNMEFKSLEEGVRYYIDNVGI